MCKEVSEVEYDQLVSYARRTKNDPEQFLEDSLLTFNHEFWKKRAKRFGDKIEFSFPDTHLNERENHAVKKVVQQKNPKKILDMGCGNGYSTLDITSGIRGGIITGIDYSDKAIDFANKLATERKRSDTTFVVGQMENLPFSENNFEMVYAKRALTNLPTRRLQRRALEECARVLTPGGILCVSDLFLEGYDRLNRIREKLALPHINPPNHACLFSEEDLIKITRNIFELQRVRDHTSTYYFVSRVVYPVIANAAGFEIKSDSTINLIASKLPSPEFLGLNKFYIFRKK
jgi:ubiquinone/menaquinone biosynthesis C-methylase UbiE